MAARAMKNVQSIGNGVTIMIGRFRPNGASAIDNTLNGGTPGWTVARTGVGQYTITLADGWVTHGAIIPSVQLNAAADGFIQLRGAIDVTTAKTFVLENCVAATPTEIASHANNWVHFVAYLKNSELA